MMIRIIPGAADGSGRGPVSIAEVVANVLTEGARAARDPLPGPARLARLAREARAKAGLAPLPELVAVRLVWP